MIKPSYPWFRRKLTWVIRKFIGMCFFIDSTVDLNELENFKVLPAEGLTGAFGLNKKSWIWTKY